MFNDDLIDEGRDTAEQLSVIFQRLGAQIDLTQINSLVEDKAMLAENLQHWAERERQEGQKEPTCSAAGVTTPSVWRSRGWFH